MKCVTTHEWAEQQLLSKSHPLRIHPVAVLDHFSNEIS